MTATILEMRQPMRLECSACGAKADAACDCGAPYVPPGGRAAKAIADNPELSARAIAAKIGVDEKTVRAVMVHGTAGNPAVVTTQGLVGPDGVIRRQGLDGKWRRLPRKPPEEDMPTREEADESYQQTIYDHVCLSVDKEMSGETRQRFFAHLRRKYHVNFTQSPAQRGDKGLPA